MNEVVSLLGDVFDQSDDCVCVASPRMEPLFVNESGRRMIGLDVDEDVSAKKLSEFYTEATWKLLRKTAIPAVKESDFWKGEGQLCQAATRESIDVAILAQLVRHPRTNRPLCLVLVHRDSRDRKRAEVVEVFNEAILNASIDPIITVDHEGVITEFNRAATRTFGRPPEEVLGKRPEEVLFAPDDEDGGQGRVGRYLSTRQGSMLGQRMELTAIRASGETFPVETAMTISRVKGRPIFTFFLRDISERKQWEADLRRAKEAAEEANRAKGFFLANMSHEIRTPMNAVLGLTELVLDSELTDPQREYLEMVRDSGESLLTLINGILDFSKIEAGKLELEDSEFSLRRSLGDALRSLAIRGHGKGLDLALRVRPDVPDQLVGDAVRLRQVVVNLVGNAVKFTEEGEVEVDVQTESIRGVEITLHVTVRDTGIGIPEDKSSTIFGAFDQADATTTRRFGGTGLGLSISKRLVQLMNGRIWVDSEVDQGSTFHFTAGFKLAPQATDHDVAVSQQLKGLRVLVVDDNLTCRRVVEEILAHRGMHPTAVDSTYEAVRTIQDADEQQKPFDVLVVDDEIPQLDGHTPVHRIRNVTGASCPIVTMISSFDRRRDAVRSRDSGVLAQVMKPVEETRLLNTMAYALGLQSEGQVDPMLANPDRVNRVGPLRILLTEDSYFNQRLAIALLEKRGHSVVVAQNGREAVEAVAEKEFDLVLMDVEMPEMDGLEASRTIRNHEKETSVHIPIVAMTAQAMKGDRERCLAAGMDNYVSKPIHARELFEVIADVVGYAETPTEPSGPSPAPEEAALADKETEAELTLKVASEPQQAEASAADVTGEGLEPLDWENAFAAVGGDQELLKDVLNAFLDECPVTLATIRKSLATEDAVTLRRAAHTMKGGLRFFGTTTASTIAQQIESLAAEGELSKVEADLAKLETALERVLPTVREFCQTDSEV